MRYINTFSPLDTSTLVYYGSPVSSKRTPPHVLRSSTGISYCRLRMRVQANRPAKSPFARMFSVNRTHTGDLRQCSPPLNQC